MRIISAKIITKEISQLWQQANFVLGSDIIKAIKNSLRKEKSAKARDVLSVILKNAVLAWKENRPICQDTGFPLVFLEIGQDVKLKGDLYKAINQGIKEGTREGFLRSSVVDCPFARKNTGNNTPAVIFTEIVKGSKLKISIMAKGAGSENCSRTVMLLPTAGEKEIENFVLESVKLAGANPCPPVIIGLGIGGTLDKAVILSKKRLYLEHWIKKILIENLTNLR